MDMLAILFALTLGAQAPAASSAAPLAGVWQLNTQQSDAARAPDGDRRGTGGDREGGRRGGYGGGRGGYGGRAGGRGMGRGGMRGDMDPEASARMREAMRGILEPSDRLTIVQTDSMILMTAGDGRTTRLSPDGKKIKDESTGIERKTKWDAGKLVSEITGLGRGKATQTFVVDPETHQLRITVQIEGGRAAQPRAILHVYDKGDKN